MPIELKTVPGKLSRGVSVALAASLAYGCASFPTMSVAPEQRPDPLASGGVSDMLRGGNATPLRTNTADVMQIPGVAQPPRPTPVPPATAEQIASLVPDEPINASLPPQPLVQYLNTAFTEVLKVPYSLGPDIASRNTVITVNAPATVSKRAYLTLLQNTLRGYGLTMAIRNNAVLITEDGASAGGGFGNNQQPTIIRSRSASDTPQTNGRVVQIFQLIALQASPDLVDLARRIGGGNFQSASLQIDTAANALAIEGSGRQVSTMVNILRNLDQPAYAGAQVARLEPVYQSPADFAANLQAALTAEGYIVSADPLGQKSISILPLVSTNQTLVFAADRETMARVQFWASQIDAPSAMGAQASTFVYEVRNTSATTIGQMLANAGAQAGLNARPTTGQGAAGGFPGAGGAGNVVAQALRGGNATNNNAGRGGNAATRGGFQNQQIGGGAAGGGLGGTGGGGFGGANAANRTTGTTANRTTTNNQVVTGASPTGGAITVDDASNRILFTGSATQFSQLRQLLQRLDIPARQVIVEVTIAEVTMTDETRAGLEFFFSATANGGPLTGGTGTFPAPTAPFPGAGAGQAGTGLGLGTAGATLNFTNANGDLRAAFNAFASNNKVNILSRPFLPARSGSPASIQVGVDVPIITSQRAATTVGTGIDTLQTVSYRPTGNLLTITPTVYGDDKVDITVSQEVSDVRDTTNSTIDSPSFGSRVINTTLSLSDGRSAILGGLIEDSFAKGNRGVPFLKDVPVLGQAFRTDTVSGRKTQLVVLITPMIVHSDDEMSNMVSQITDDLNRAFQTGRGSSYTLTPYPLGGALGIYPPNATVVGGATLRRQAAAQTQEPAPAPAEAPAPIETPAAPPPATPAAPPPPPPPPPAAPR